MCLSLDVSYIFHFIYTKIEIVHNQFKVKVDNKIYYSFYKQEYFCTQLVIIEDESGQ